MKTENWKEFKINKLFEIESCKGLDAGHLKLQDHRDDAYKYEFIGRTNSNYGVQGYIKEQNFLFNNKDTITISQVGTIVAQYRNNDYYTSQNMFKLIPKFETKENILLFLVCVLNGYLKPYFGYDSYPTLTSLKKDVIKLPEKNEEPDWKYMERYIEEIKIKYINELEKDNNLKIDKALEITGLSHKDLDQDLVVRPARKYEEFRVGDLFEIKPTKSYNLRNNELYDLGGKNPVIANSSLNNGITGFTNKPCTEKGNIITFSDTTDHNAIFYQPYDFVGYSHIQGLYPIKHENKWNRATLLYFMTVFKKIAASCNFSYGNKFTRYIAMDFKIILPAIDKDTPDFDYMEKAIYIYIYIYSAKKIKLKKLSNEKEIELLRRLI